MSIQIKSYFLLILLLGVNTLSSHSQSFSTYYPIDIDESFNNYLIDAALSIDGNLLMTGYTTNDGNQAYVVKINRSGKIIQRITIGETDQNMGMGITEDNHGRILIAWNSKERDEDEYTKPKIRLMNHNGETVWEKKMDNRYSREKAVVKSVHFDVNKEKIICFGIKDKALWMGEYDKNGIRSNEKRIKKGIKDFEISEDQHLSILYYRNHYYIYCGVYYGSNKDKKPLVVKLDSNGKYVKHTLFPDHSIEEAGTIVALNNNYFAMVGTTYDAYKTSPKEDVFFLKINEQLEKSKDSYRYLYKEIKFRKKIYNHSNDFGIALLPIAEDSILIAATTKSYERGAFNKKTSLFYIKEDGRPLDKNPEIIDGKSLAEQVKKMLYMPDNSIWVIGQRQSKKLKSKNQIFAGVIPPSNFKGQPSNLTFFDTPHKIIFDQETREGYLKIGLIDSASPEPVKGMKILPQKNDLIDFLYSEIPIVKLTPGDTLYKRVPFKLRSTPSQNSKVPIHLEIVDNTGEVLSRINDTISVTGIAIPEQEINKISEQEVKYIPVKKAEKIVEQEIKSPSKNKNNTEELKAIWKEEYPNDSLLVRAKNFELNITTFSKDSLAVAHFSILHNGRTIQPSGVKMDEVVLTSSEKNIFKFKANIFLATGKNRISVLVDNGIQIDTTKELMIEYVPAEASILWVMSIGIKDKTGTTSFTQKDAIDFASIFEDQASFLYKKTIQQVIVDEELTTAEQIVFTINKLPEQAEKGQIKEKDVLVFFISGHGFIDSKIAGNKFKIKGSNYNELNKKYTSFDFKEDILDILEGLSCKKLVFIDACKSGSASLDISKINATDTGIITSCQIGESSYEDSLWENGALTKVVTELLSDIDRCKALDTNKDNALSMEEIFPLIQNGVSQLVKNHRKESQTPLISAPLPLKNTPFFYFQ